MKDNGRQGKKRKEKKRKGGKKRRKEKEERKGGKKRRKEKEERKGGKKRRKEKERKGKKRKEKERKGDVIFNFPDSRGMKKSECSCEPNMRELCREQRIMDDRIPAQFDESVPGPKQAESKDRTENR